MSIEKFQKQMKNFVNLDATQGLFFARQLEDIEQQMYRVKYPEFEAEKFLPVRKQIGAGKTKHTWRMIDGRGAAVPMAGSEDGAPTVDVDADESNAPLMSWILGYKYDIEEIDAAKETGTDLDAEKALVVRRGLAQRLNQMALLGYSAKGIYGLFNQPGTLTYSTPNGAATTPQWSTKTADEILTDLFAMADGMANSTLDVEGSGDRALNMLLPKTLIRLIGTKRLGTSASDTTVKEFFEKQRPNITMMGANYLDTAGASSSKRGVVYDPQQVKWLVSIPFQQLPVQERGFVFKVNCRARGGGVITPYPKSILYADNL